MKNININLSDIDDKDVTDIWIRQWITMDEIKWFKKEIEIFQRVCSWAIR